MKLRLTKEKGFLILWQMVYMALIILAVHERSYVYGLFALIMANAIFDKDN